MEQVKDCIVRLAHEQFGEAFADVDFFGPLEGEDMMGEIVLKEDLDLHEVLGKLHVVHEKARDQGWHICLGYIVDGRYVP